MNHSFEQLFKKIHPNKDLPSKTAYSQANYFKMQLTNHGSKTKNLNHFSNSKYPPELYQSSLMSNGSVKKNIHKPNHQKSNHKRSNKLQDTTTKKSKQQISLLKKCPTLQLTKKQQEIREAIEYRFEKSKMKNYKYCSGSVQFDEKQDHMAREIIDNDEEYQFREIFGYLTQLKVVNLYEYSKFKEQTVALPKQRSNQKIIVSKAFKKPKSGSRHKIKTQSSVDLHEKILHSSSVEKNFKSIKDIYLNAISNLANKNTVKANNKLFRSENSEMKNKGSKNTFNESEKKSYRNEYHSTKIDKNNSSSSALHQNYFSCISSRDNKKNQKTSSHYKTGTQEKLDQTLLINETNSSQWKSVIMKVDDAFMSKERNCEPSNDHKKFKLKLKDHEFQKNHKSGLNSVHRKFITHPHSYREYIKSPKFKRYVINQDDERNFNRKTQNPRNVSSVKNLVNQNLLKQSTFSIQEETLRKKKTKK